MGAANPVKDETALFFFVVEFHLAVVLNPCRRQFRRITEIRYDCP